MKTLHVIRAVVAWSISPFFMLLDLLHDVDGPTRELIESWQKWAFMNYEQKDSRHD